MLLSTLAYSDILHFFYKNQVIFAEPQYSKLFDNLGSNVLKIVLVLRVIFLQIFEKLHAVYIYFIRHFTGQILKIKE